MTLNDRLDKIPYDTPIKVGCSSAFFYCYYNDMFTKLRIQKESNRYHSDLKRLLLKRKEELDSLEERRKKAIDRVLEGKKGRKEKQVKIDEINKKYDKDISTLPKVVENLQNKVNNFKPFLERNIKREYKLNMPTYENPKTIYLVVSGKEQGDYDDIETYAKKKHLPLKKEDKHWDKLLKARTKIKEKSERTKNFVKLKNGVVYKVVRNEDGDAIGLVERNHRGRKRK